MLSQLHAYHPGITCDFQIPPTPQIANTWDPGYVPPGATLDVLCPVSCGTCGPGPFGLLVWTLLGYGFAIIPVTYMFSLAFKKHTTAQMVTLLANIVFGLFLVLTSFVLAANKSTKALNDALQPLFRISPSFNLGWSVFQMMTAAGGGMSTRPDDAPPLGPVSPPPTIRRLSPIFRRADQIFASLFAC